MDDQKEVVVGVVVGNLHAGQAVLSTAAAQLVNAVPARILIIGKAGTGKSTLIHRVFPGIVEGPAIGDGEPTTDWQAIEKKWSGPPPCAIKIHDSQGLEVGGCVESRLKNWIYYRCQRADLADRLHCVWYVWSLGGALRVEESEVELIRHIHVKCGLPVLVVLTFADSNLAQERIPHCRATIEHKVGDCIRGIYVTSNQPMLYTTPPTCPSCHSGEDMYSRKGQWNCGVCDSKGPLTAKWEEQLEGLVEATSDAFQDDAVRNSFNRAQAVCLRSKIKASAATVLFSVAASTAIGANPIPFSDAALLIPLESSMITALAYIWDIKLSVRALLGLGGGQVIFSQTVAVGLASMLKLFVGPGSAAGGTINAVVAGTLTTALGVSYTVGFYRAWKRGWMALSEEELLEKLKTLVSIRRVRDALRLPPTSQEGFVQLVETEAEQEDAAEEA